MNLYYSYLIFFSLYYYHFRFQKRIFKQINKIGRSPRIIFNDFNVLLPRFMPNQNMAIQKSKILI